MKYLYFFFFFFLSQSLFAQAHNHGGSNLAETAGSMHANHEKHPAQPPHGGELINVGKYDLEVVLNVMVVNENFSIYFLNHKLKTIDATKLSGKAVFRYKQGEEITYEFKNDNPEKLYCNVQDIVNEFVVVITVTYKGKDYTTVCEYTGLKGRL